MQTNFYISFDWHYFDVCTSVLYIICTINIYRKDQYLCLDKLYIFTVVAPVVKWLRTLIFSTLNHSSSRRCGFEPCSGHMLVRQAKFCLLVVRCFFLGDLPFSPLLGLTQLKMSEIILTGHNPPPPPTSQ